LADFLYTSTAEIYVEGDLVFTDSSIEKCSQFCVSADGFECKSFNYCQGSRSCLLNKGLIQNTTRQTGVAKEVCRNYKSKQRIHARKISLFDNCHLRKSSLFERGILFYNHYERWKN